MLKVVAQCQTAQNINNQIMMKKNWVEVSNLMHRLPHQCYDKWRYIQTKRMKEGPFTAEEDGIIKQRAAEWGDKGEGLWVSLE